MDLPPPVEPAPMMMQAPAELQRGAFRVVHSFDELRAAVREAASGAIVDAGNQRVSVAPITIVLASIIEFPETLEIPSTTFGLTIRATHGAFIFARSNIGSYFKVSGFHHRIEGVNLAGVPGDVIVDNFVELGDSVEQFWLVDCDSSRATYLLFRASGTLFLREIHVRGCNEGKIDLDELTRGSIMGNSRIDVEISGGISTAVTGNPGAGTIVLDGTASGFSITGNTFLSGSITTSASSGGHAITGNAGCGTPTAHGTDAVGDNT